MEQLNIARIQGLNEEIETLRREATDRSVELKKMEQRCEGITLEKEDALRRYCITSMRSFTRNPPIGYFALSKLHTNCFF